MMQELLEAPGNEGFELDHFHTAVRAAKSWHLYRRRPDGHFQLLRNWKGTRKSLYSVLEDFGIEPSRAAEEELMTLTESTFRVDDDEEA